MKAVAPRRPGGTNPIMLVGAVVSGLVLVVLLWYTGVLNLSIFGSKPPSTAGLIPIPTPARTIPAYTRVTRDHLWDPTKNQIAVVYLPPSAVTIASKSSDCLIGFIKCADIFNRSRSAASPASTLDVSMMTSVSAMLGSARIHSTSVWPLTNSITM